MLRIVLSLSLVASVSCKGKDDGATGGGKAEPSKVIDAAVAMDAAGMGTSGRHRDQTDWVPAEFKKGRGKWKDPGVYVDGVPVGIIKGGELPPDLEPFWKGDDDEGDPATQRFRILDYLEAVGADIKGIKEIQIYSGGPYVMRISGAEARKFRAGFHFRLGQGVTGKALIGIPPGMKVDTSFDKLGTVAVYIKKPAPKVDEKQFPLKDGKRIYTVPYYGDPVRGGVRIYKDNRMVFHLKRNKLEESEDLAKWTEGKKELRWKLGPFLAKSGVVLDDVVVAEVIRDEKRFEQLSKEDIDGAFFTAIPQSSGQILVNGKLRVQALALYTKPRPVPVQKSDRSPSEGPPKKSTRPAIKR